MRRYTFLPALLLLTACPIETTETDPAEPPPPPPPPVEACEQYELIEQADVDAGLTLTQGGCYRVDEVLDVELNTLTIEPGVTVVFAQQAGFAIFDQGRFNALGTAEAPIVLTGEEQVRGYWAGLFFGNTNSADNVLEHVELSYAGSSRWSGADEDHAALLLGTGNDYAPVKVRIANVRFEENATLAFAIRGQAANIDGFADNEFVNNDMALAVHPDHVGTIDAGTSFEGNDDPRLQVSWGAGSVTTDQTWLNHGVPYHAPPGTIDQYINVLADLVIEPGTELQFGANVSLRVGTDNIGLPLDGSLTAVGTEEAPIRFTGASASRGFWRGLLFRGANDQSELRHCIVEYGGSNGQDGGGDSVANVFVSQGRLTIADTTLRESGGYGISIRSGSDVDACAGMILEDNELEPLLGECPTP